MFEWRCIARNFSGQGVGGEGGVELAPFNKDFFENSRNRGPTGKNFGAFSRRYL